MLKYGMPVQTLCSWNVPVFKRKVIGATILCTLCCRESGRCQEVFGKGNQIYFVFKDPTPHSSSVFASVISSLNKLRSDLTKFLAKVLFVQQNNKGRETFFTHLVKQHQQLLNSISIAFVYRSYILEDFFDSLDSQHTERFADLGKLNLLMVVRF
jgi:hypothetical protein